MRAAEGKDFCPPQNGISALRGQSRDTVTKGWEELHQAAWILKGDRTQEDNGLEGTANTLPAQAT